MRPEQAILYIADVAALLGKSYPAIQGMDRRGDLPPSFRLGGKVAWKRETIMAWIDGQESEARAKREAKEKEKGRAGRKRLGYEVEIVRAST
ncbi:transcriptional regulator, AlpA family [Methylomagnum ishizawai]|uniref:Transcriptional regulator, AlpA family n=1 Tax=Methylomagnum ishizawai TaxID=1760988 RepID=A0A1Y6CUK4_9GAMM|nr:helix-turn-helix domain-containing protein [Methylomagnum ishizawai]SMF93976.1 transcriptional regulator, AlpA family [Methylomagnum ishizawai]